MRKVLAVLAAGTAVSAAVPASAATIVQTDNESQFYGFSGFNSNLGTLTRVTVYVSLIKLRPWLVEVPSGTPLPSSVPYSVNGTWTLDTRFTGSPTINIALTGNSSAAVSSMAPATNRGSFYVTATGEGSFDLNTSFFVDRAHFEFDGADLGYFGAADTTFTALPSARFSRNSLGCFGEDVCGSTFYRLTYEYTPAIAAGVPEPATWATIIGGFGLIGGAMRRRRRVAVRFA